jgi:hypothetical protein
VGLRLNRLFGSSVFSRFMPWDEEVRYVSLRYDFLRYDSLRYDSLRYDLLRFGNIAFWDHHPMQANGGDLPQNSIEQDILTTEAALI